MIQPDCWDAVRLACATVTQWRVGAGGGLLGLDYAACRAAADAMGIDWAAAFAGLRVIEAEVLGESGRRSAAA